MDEEENDDGERLKHVWAFFLGVIFVLTGFLIMNKKPLTTNQLYNVMGTFKALDNGSKGTIWLTINEKSNRFEINPASPRFSFKDFKEGDTVQITIKKEDKNVLGKTSNVDIDVIGLKSVDKFYFGINEYNKSISKNKESSWGMVFAGIYSIYLGFKKKKIEIVDVLIGLIIFIGYTFIATISK